MSWFKKHLFVQVLVAAVLGIVVGLVFREQAEILDPIGSAFLSLLQFLVVPLVILSLLSGILQMGSIRELGNIGMRFFIYLVITAVIASSVGALFGLLFRPGRGLDFQHLPGGEVESEDYSLVDTILGWVPTNFFADMAEGNMIPIIIGTVLFGVAILSIGEEKVPVVFQAARQGTEIILKVTNWIIALSPIGIFALMAVMVGTMGTDMLGAAVTFIVADYLAMFTMLLVGYPLVLALLARVNPVRFYRNVAPALLFAGSTASSSATIPVSMRVAGRNVGASRKVCGFTIPFGATATMDGMAVVLGVIAIFAADAYGLEITFALIAQTVLMGLALSIGAAGVRGAGIVMSTVLLQSMGLPMELIPLLAAIWPILDIGHTTTNVTGDHVGTVVVAHGIKELDREVFSSKNPAFDPKSADVEEEFEEESEENDELVQENQQDPMDELEQYAGKS